MTVMMTVIIKKSAKMPVMTLMTEESIWFDRTPILGPLEVTVSRA
jgi:hypothetical protein